LCDERGHDNLDDATVVVFILACLLLALPVFATYFALRVKNLIVAAVLTWIAFCVPYGFAMAECSFFIGEEEMGLGSVLPAVFFNYLIFALLACFLLRHSLSRRIYSF
jgi:hypothetical protein